MTTPNITNNQLTAEHLFYEINDQFIVNDLSFSVSSGEVLFIEGSNGSGKTTLLRLLCGLMQPDDGKISWNGDDIHSDPFECYQQLTYLGHMTGVKQELTPLENLAFFSALSGQPLKDKIDVAIEWVGLSGYEHSPGRHLSYGQQRRIALARLKLEQTALWILDEPFSGLDKHMIASLQELFTEHVKQGGILILTSHQPIELNQVNNKHLHLDA